MKIKNTLSRNKIIRFADAFIEVPVKAQWISINCYGSVYASETPPYLTDFGDVYINKSEAIEITDSATLVAQVEDFGGAQVISIEDLMAGI